MAVAPIYKINGNARSISGYANISSLISAK